MKNFISLQKRKGLYVVASEVIHNNDGLVHQLNHELMKYGYVLSRDVFDTLSTQSEAYIQDVYNDLLQGIKRVVGGDGHEPIYRNFPQSVLALSYTEYLMNAICHYWSWGTWRPEDAEYVQREFKLEPVNYKSLSLLTKSEFDSIFTDILYSGSSVSAFDKQILDWFIDNQYTFDFSKITFKETSAYVGKRLMDVASTSKLRTKDATDVLRIWSAYSGGDEGLKENTKFKNPNANQRFVLMNTLNGANNLEESFKIYREKWLRLLFYLNPRTKKNQIMFPNVYKFAEAIRNNPKELRTFNSRVEELFAKGDISVLDLLKTRNGVFARRLDHCVRVFGIVAINKWLETNPNFLQLVSTYNHFTDRDKEQSGRGAVLAGQTKSEVVTYDALEPLDTKLVTNIKFLLTTSMGSIKSKELAKKSIFIDRALYYRPLAVNNRASSLSLDGKCNGTVEVCPAGKVIRMYAHWEGYYDIDLSGLVITKDNGVMKVGWNGQHVLTDSIVYSGDNTGYDEKNAEYLDIVVDKLPSNVEWVITEARIYSGKKSYKDFSGKALAGWMMREKPEANKHWLPQTIEHAQVLNSESKTAYLLALHVPTRNIVYLDLSMGDVIVSTSEDALKMRTYLENLVTFDDGSADIKWDKLNQGHVINLLSENVVAEKETADVVFDENSTWESIAKYL